MNYTILSCGYALVLVNTSRFISSFLLLLLQADIFLSRESRCTCSCAAFIAVYTFPVQHSCSASQPSFARAHNGVCTLFCPVKHSRVDVCFELATVSPVSPKQARWITPPGALLEGWEGFWITAITAALQIIAWLLECLHQRERNGRIHVTLQAAGF